MSRSVLPFILIISSQFLGNVFTRPISEINGEDSSKINYVFGTGMFVSFLFVGVVVSMSLAFSCCPCIGGQRNQGYEELSGAVTPADVVRKERPSGIRNHSSTCYMNSIIQALASSSVIIEQLKKYPNDYRASALLKIINHVNHSDSDKDNNAILLKKLAVLLDWNKTSQQDAFELLSKILNEVYNNLNQALIQTMPPMLLLQCVYNKESNKIQMQKYLGLSVPLSGTYETGVAIEELVNNFFEPTMIDDDPNNLTWIQILGIEPPKVLILQIQANKINAQSRKMEKPTYYINYKITANFHLKFGTIDGTQSDSTVLYHLKSIVVHAGELGGGHYVTYRVLDGKWYLVNDETVQRVSNFNPSKVVPYILIYELQ